MSAAWALAAARTLAGIAARVAAAGPRGYGRFTLWDYAADWCVDGAYSRALAAEAAARTRVAHLEAAQPRHELAAAVDDLAARCQAGRMTPDQALRALTEQAGGPS